MSKSYKDEIITTTEKELSKKEQYDLEKQKKETEKNKQKKKNNSTKKKPRKKHQTNLGARIFATIMLILMIGSIVATIAAYIG